MWSEAGQQALRLVVVLACVGGITFVGSRLSHVNAATVGFVYLVTIVVVATVWGLLEAVLASLVAGLCFNFFFLSPVGTFHIADPQNWVAFLAFLLTSIIVSQLSTRAKRRSREVVERHREMERLYALSCAILRLDPQRPAAQQIAAEIRHIFDFRAVSLYDRSSGEVHYAGPEVPPVADDRLRQTAEDGKSSFDEATLTSVAPIMLGGQPIGSLAFRGVRLPETALRALANLLAVALEKERSQHAASQAEAVRQSGELKSALLDAIAHEFKTPLTSIKAAATALLCTPVPNPREERELLTVVNEEVDHLGRLVTEATQTARIEAGKIGLSRGPHSAKELISTALEQMKTVMEGRSIGVTLAEDLPMVSVDGELMVVAIRQLLDNAVKYSPPSAPVSVEARNSEGAVVVSVCDQGPGIRAAEHSRVFDKFYRSPATRQQMPGTGMGLSIARDIVRAHGGEIWVENRPGLGARFCISVPTTSEAQPK